MLNASTQTKEQNGLQWQRNEEVNISWGTISERRVFSVVSGECDAYSMILQIAVCTVKIKWSLLSVYLR